MASQWKSTSDKLKSNNPKTYLAYLSEDGANGNFAYRDRIATAKNEKALSDSDYGAVASMLLSSGLSNSGYQDYLKSQADKRYLASTAIAENRKKTDEYKNLSGYEKYLSDYDALQNKISKSVLKAISEGGDFNFNNALAKAISAGLSKHLATETASEGVRLAKEQAYISALAFAKANNLTAAKAKDYALFLGLDDNYATRLYDEISTFSENEKAFYSSMSAEDYYNYIMSQSRK